MLRVHELLHGRTVGLAHEWTIKLTLMLVETTIVLHDGWWSSERAVVRLRASYVVAEVREQLKAVVQGRNPHRTSSSVVRHEVVCLGLSLRELEHVLVRLL